MLGTMPGTLARFVWASFFFLLGWCYLISLLIATMINGNILPVVSLLLLKPISKDLHTGLLQYLAKVGWGSIIHYAENIGGISPIYTGDLSSKAAVLKGSKILLSNHVCMTDGLFVFSVADRAGMLGNVRFFAKRSLLFVPFFGLAAYHLRFVFLTRNWEKDKHKLNQVFGEMVEGARTNPFWMTIFPEGTRITASKLKASQDFARSRGMSPVFQHVLVPRSKGFIATFHALRNSIDAVVDVTVGYQGDQDAGQVRPTLGDVLLGRTGTWPLHIHVRVLPVEAIPREEEALSKWLHDLFAEKDRLLQHFREKGCFPGPRDSNLPQRSPGYALLHGLTYFIAAFLVALWTWSLLAWLRHCLL